MPTFMHEVLQQLNWSNGMHIPVSNEENKYLEELLNSRNKELEQLRNHVEIQDAKEKELNYLRKSAQNEHAENMQLLATHKAQLESEENLSKLMEFELSQIAKDKIHVEKNYTEIEERVERVHGEIAYVLRKIETLRNSVGEEKGSLEEWREALKRSEADINTINNFNKEDAAQIHELETRRQQLKIEHDRKHKILSQICGNLVAEEKSAERISELVLETMSERRRITSMYSGAVENLRQRDKEIQQFKRELQVMREYTSIKNDSSNEKKEFLKTQCNNNAEAERDVMDLRNNLASRRQHLRSLEEDVKSLYNEIISSKRELEVTSRELSNYRIGNKHFNRKIKEKQDSIDNAHRLIEKYKEKLSEILDDSKSAAQRTKQLEDMLNNEDKYLKQITSENERIQQQLFRSQQHLLALQKEEELLVAESKGFKSNMVQMNAFLNKLERELAVYRENLYNLTYQLDAGNSKVAKLEGDATEVKNYDELEQKVKRLEVVLKDKTETVILLSKQMTKLEGSLSLLNKNIENKRSEQIILQDRLNKVTSEVEGALREERLAYRNIRNLRTDESILQLRIDHAQKMIQQLSEKGDTLTKAHLDLHAAMCVREAEVNKKQAVVLSQRSVLQKERSALIAQIKTEESKIEQLKTRYEIYLSSLGKDESGNVYSVAYFKIKNAQEKSELQQEGDALDAQIKKGENEIAALEATLQVVDAVNKRFVHNLTTIKEDDPEMLEYNDLCETYNRCRILRSQIISQVKHHTKQVEKIKNDINNIKEQLQATQNVRERFMDEFNLLVKDIQEQQVKLNRANNLRRKSGASIKRKINSTEIYQIHEKQFHTKIIQEANRSASAQLRALSWPPLNEMALKEGLNLPEIYSAPPGCKDRGSLSSKSSYVSSQESWIQYASVELSERSTDSDRRLQARSTNKQSESQASSSTKIDKKNGNEGRTSKDSASSSALPVSVVVLGIDTMSQKESK